MENQTEKVSNLFNAITGWVITEILIIMLVSWVVIKASEIVLPWIANLFPAKLRSLTLNIVPILRVLVLCGLIIWIIPLIFNITLQNFIFVAGALSVAVGFAVTDLASSVIAGFVALFEKPYRLGDWITIGPDYGEVVGIGMRAVQLRTPDDDVVSISHDRIWTDNVSNSNDGHGTLMCVATFHIAHNQPVSEIAPLLKNVARTSPYLNLDRDIFVVMENDLFSMTYKLRAYPFEPRNQFAFVTDLTERGNTALREAGIEMTSIPHGHLRDRFEPN